MMSENRVTLEGNQAVIIDNGSGVSKVGLSGENTPRSCFTSVVGRHLYDFMICYKEFYFGQEAQSKRGILKITSPIEHGIITNWNDMCLLWHYCFDTELQLSPSSHPCLLTQTPANPKSNRQKTTEIMFQQFDLPAYYLAMQPILSLYASGRTTGLLLDVGHDLTHAISIYEGQPLPNTILRNYFGGHDLSQNFMQLINQIIPNLGTSLGQQQSQLIKERVCYVALDFQQQIKKYKLTRQHLTPYELPDDQIIKIGSQKFRSPQLLFTPQKQLPSLHNIIYNSITKCNIDIRKQLLSNIVLSGGTTMLPGIAERLNKQLITLFPSTAQIKINTDKKRKLLVWIGGSMLASLSTFQSMWITKKQYQESGSTVVNRKCSQLKIH